VARPFDRRFEAALFAAADISFLSATISTFSS
jgi:hypothetical protein